MQTTHETWLIFRRAMQQSLRNPAWVVISLGQPLLYLALFVPLLRSLVGGPGFPPGDEWQVMVPALLFNSRCSAPRSSASGSSRSTAAA